MDKKLTALFEQALDAEARGGEDILPSGIAAVAAGWADLQKKRPAAVSAEDPAGRLAAFLSGALEGEALESFEAEFAAVPAELQELISTRHFVDEVEAKREEPPRQLLGLALSGLETAGGGGGSGGLAALFGGLRAVPGNWRLAGGALATAVLAIVVATSEIGGHVAAPFAAAPTAQVGAVPAIGDQSGGTAGSASQASAQQQLFNAEKAMQTDEAMKEAATKNPVGVASRDACDGATPSADEGAGPSDRTVPSKHNDNERNCRAQRLAEPAGPANADMPAAAAAMPAYPGSDTAPADAAAAPAENTPYSMGGASAPAAMPPRE